MADHLADLPTLLKDPRLTDDEVKRAYARLWYANPDRQYTCADGILFGEGKYELQVTCLACRMWESDPVVIAEKVRLHKELGLTAKLPSKEEIALAAWEMTKEANRTVADRLAGMRMAADILGYTQKGSTVNVNASNVNSPVLVVPADLPEADWSAKAQAQQTALQVEARATQH